MRERWAAAAIGFFVIGGALLLGIGIIVLGRYSLFEDTVRAVIFFDRAVVGLNTGSPVALRGVTVGSVERIALQIGADTESARVPVYITISPDKFRIGRDEPDVIDIRALVARGLRAQLQTQSFVTGQQMVELDFKPETPAQMVGEEGLGVPEIPALTSEIERLRSAVTSLPIAQTLTQVDDTVRAIRQLAEAAEQQVRAVSRNVATTTEVAKETMRTSAESLQVISREVAATAQSLRALSAELQTQLDQRGGELSTVLSRGSAALARIETLAANANDLVEPRSEARQSLNTTLRELSAAAASLRSFAETIERNPNAIFLGKERR